MDKKTRICIVGGGPAGLSAGMYLEQKGYENYTILERLDRVGGKCWSPTYNGRRYEMGAIMGVPSYYAVHDVEEFCGITHDGPKLNRNYKNKDGKVIEPFEPKKNNVFAIIGLVFGIITSVFFWLPFINMVPGIAGIVCSIIGLTQKNAGKKGMATAGLITSIAGILIGFMILGLAVMSES